jgi:hypothetical protein
MREAALIATAALAALLAGCAGTAANRKPGPAEATLAARGVECHSERLTGTLIAATVCTTLADRERQGIDLQQSKDSLHNGPVPTCPPHDMSCR